MSITGKCKECGFEFEGNTACPNCGSTFVNYVIELSDKVEFHDGVDITDNKKVGKRKRPALEAYYGDEQMRSTGEWIQKERVVDRENDIYHEKVVDPKTGEITHECNEKLFDHIRHGSDKPKEDK